MNPATLVVAFFAVIVVLNVIHRADAIVHGAMRAVGGVVGFCCGLLLAEQLRANQEQALFVALGGALVGVALTPKRSRRIPAKVRRRAIAKFELDTGEKYNSRKHELDHYVPFSKGGGHVGRNVRVIPKKQNRVKGAKSPWWDMFG